MVVALWVNLVGWGDCVWGETLLMRAATFTGTAQLGGISAAGRSTTVAKMHLGQMAELIDIPQTERGPR